MCLIIKVLTSIENVKVVMLNDLIWNYTTFVTVALEDHYYYNDVFEAF